MDIRIVIKIHHLICLEMTGKPSILAIKVDVSERTVYNYLEFMKTELNAPIKYNAYKKTYYYDGICELKFIN